MLLFFLSGCGSESGSSLPPAQTPSVEYDPAAVVWTGLATDRPDFAGLYERVQVCAGTAAPVPMITVIDASRFTCLGVAAYGCMLSGDGIYISTMILSYSNGGALSHEYVHWLGYGHESPVMDQCGWMQF